jgi:putative ABC transport system permease protein
VAIVLIFTQLGFQNALYDSAVGIPRALDADILIAGPTFKSWADSPPWMNRALLYEAQSVPGVRSVAPLYSAAIQIASPLDGHGLSCYLLAFSPQAPVFLPADIAALTEQLALPDRLIMDRQSRVDFEAIRDAVEARGESEITVLNATDTLQRIGWVTGLFDLGPSFTIDGTMITSDLNYYRLTSTPLDRVSVGVLRVADGYDIKRVRDQLAETLQGRAQVFLKQDFIDNEIAYYAENTPIGYIFRLGLIVGAFVGIVFISQALHGIVSDNLREYATLRAIGYQQGFFSAVVGFIALVLSVVAYVPSSFLAWGVYALAADASKLPLRMNLPDMAAIFALVLIMAVTATLLAVGKIRKADPVDLFS